MAQRRMFSLKIVDTDSFVDMPSGARLLYYDLAMRADDDGFVSNPKKIMRMTNAAEDDFKVLIAKKFVIPFDSGVCVISDWKIHNYIQSDRYQETMYKEEKAMLKEENGMYTKCIQDVSKMDTQDRLGKVRIGKDRVRKGKVNNTILCEQDSQEKDGINEVIKMFEIVNPSYEKMFPNKTQRSAAARLLKKWTLPQIQAVVNILPKLNADQYAKGKSITPLQLEDNLGYIKAFIDKTRDNSIRQA